MMKVNKRISIATFIIADILIAIVSAIAPFVFRFGIFSIEAQPWYLDLVAKTLPVDIFILLTINSVLRLYNRIWTYNKIKRLGV